MPSLLSWEGMPYRNINSKILIVIPRPKTACKDTWFSADNSPNLIAIKSFNFGCQLWLNYKAYSFITHISELNFFWGFQICAALISSSNGFRVISVFVKVTQIPKSERYSPNLIAIKLLNFGRRLWQNYKVYSFLTNITEWHLFQGFQKCTALIYISNGFWVTIVFVRVTKFLKSNQAYFSPIHRIIEAWKLIYTLKSLNDEILWVWGLIQSLIPFSLRV